MLTLITPMMFIGNKNTSTGIHFQFSIITFKVSKLVLHLLTYKHIINYYQFTNMVIIMEFFMYVKF